VIGKISTKFSECTKAENQFYLEFCSFLSFNEKSRLPSLQRISYGENNHKIKRSEPLKNCAV